MSRATAALKGAARGARALLDRGAGAGMIAMIGLFLVEILAGMQMQTMGVRDGGMQKKLIERCGPQILEQQGRLLAVYALLGALCGGGLGAALAGWDRARGRIGPPRSRPLAIVCGTLLVEGWQVALAAIHYPQLLADTLYAHGGWRRAAQVFLTEHVPRAWLEYGGLAALAAFAIGPALTRRGRAWVRRRFALSHALGAAALVLGAVLLARAPSGGGRSHVDARSPAPASFLLIAVDSLRADRVGPGHEDVAPRLAELATRSVRFESAYVTVPRTFPSWATILSGRWPQHHGIRHMFPDAAERRAAGPFLPHALASHGFATAVVSDFAGEIFSRLDAGFQVRRVPHFDLRTIVSQVGLNLHPGLVPWDATSTGHLLAPSLDAAPENDDPERLADQVIATVRAQHEPFFVTAFFSTPHFPYAAPDPWYRRFTSPGYEGRFRYHKPVDAFRSGAAPLDERDIAQVRGLYNGAVASVDHAIGRVLDDLARQGREDSTIVLVLADHGENLYEHGRGMGHGEHLRGDRMVHIPLLFHDPVHGFPAHAVPGIVRDVDLAPTLAGLAGVPFGGTDGVDLGPLLRGERASLDLAAYAETELWLTPNDAVDPAERLPYPVLPDLISIAPDDDLVLAPGLARTVVDAKHRAIRTERWKLHYAPTPTGAHYTLFDLTADPDELFDVAARHPEVASELRRRLEAWIALDQPVAAQPGAPAPR